MWYCVDREVTNNCLIVQKKRAGEICRRVWVFIVYFLGFSSSTSIGMRENQML